MKQNSFWVTQALLWVALFCFLSGPVQAATPSMVSQQPQQQMQSVQNLEDTLFAIRYDQEPLDARLSRLEQTVFGQAQTGSPDARISKLKSVLSPGSLGPLSPTAKTDPAAPSSNTNNETPVASKSPSKQPATPKAVSQTAQQSKTPAPGETDYPTVSQMEQKLFGKTFVQEDITNRLNRLEQQVFHMSQSGALSDRVDNLRLVVLGDTGTGAPPTAYGGGAYGNNNPGAYQPPGNYQGGYNNDPMASAAPQNYGQPSAYGQPYPSNPGDNMNMPPGNLQGASPDTLAAINDVEKEVLGHTYPMDPVNTRLDRLENKIFHTTSPEMSPDDRVQRVIAVASAGGAPQSAQAKAKTTIQVLLPIILTILPLILL